MNFENRHSAVFYIISMFISNFTIGKEKTAKLSEKSPEIPGWLSENRVRHETEQKFRGQGGSKTTTPGGAAIAYVEDVLALQTQTPEFAIGRSRSLFSDSLLMLTP